jgi:hypothetical protein
MCGHPAFGWEVVEGIRQKIREKDEKAKKEGMKSPVFTRLHEIGLVAVEVVRETVRRRVNDKLEFIYGFDADDLIRGSFEAEGKPVSIKQSSVKKHAMSILDGSNKAQIFKEIHQNKGILFGHDREDGLFHYHLNAENFVLSIVSGRFEAIGTGKYASGMSLADFLGNQTLAKRRAGHDRAEGAFQLILSGVIARRTFHEVGGALHMVVVDGEAKTAGERCRRIPEERMALATEAVEAARKSFVPEKKAVETVGAMIFGDGSLDDEEEALFEAQGHGASVPRLQGLRPARGQGREKEVRWQESLRRGIRGRSMTSINAMKFDAFTGACIFDEERGWNDEGMKTHTAEKMKPVSPDEVVEEMGLVAVYGNTGTSTIGDALRHSIRKTIAKEYAAAKSKAGGVPKTFLDVGDVARLSYGVITKMKHTHLDQEMEGRYGFTTRDYIQGSYRRGGKTIEIKEGELGKKLDEMVTWKARSREGYSLFLNAGIIAGYEPKDGFKIYRLGMIEHICEPVQEFFTADGSGRDLANVIFTDFANCAGFSERRGAIDRVEGVMGMIAAVLAASRHDIGVSGYLNIILFDGRREKNADKLWMVNDHRAKLASEIVTAETHGLVSMDDAYSLVDGLLYGGADFMDGPAEVLPLGSFEFRVSSFEFRVVWPSYPHIARPHEMRKGCEAAPP